MASDVVRAEAFAIEGCSTAVAGRFGPGYLLRKIVLQVESPDGDTMELSIDPVKWCLRNKGVQLTLPPARHSPDFRSLYWFGTTYLFTPMQAAIVAILWEAWQNGTPDVGGEYLLENAGCDREAKRMDAVFAGCEAWGAAVQSRSKGSYRLAEPVAHAEAG